MGKRVPRIVIKVVTDESTWEFSHVKGRETASGLPSPGPSKKHFAIISKAIADLSKAK